MARTVQCIKLGTEADDAAYRQRQVEASQGTTPPSTESVQRRAIESAELDVTGRESQLQRDVNQAAGTSSKNIFPADRKDKTPVWEIAPGDKGAPTEPAFAFNGL